MGANTITETSLISNYKSEKIEDSKDVKCLHRHLKG